MWNLFSFCGATVEGCSVGLRFTIFDFPPPPRSGCSLGFNGLGQGTRMTLAGHKLLLPLEQGRLWLGNMLTCEALHRVSLENRASLFPCVCRASKRVTRVCLLFASQLRSGLLGFEVCGKYCFYKVAPFGGSFSAHWWQRLPAFFVRACHRPVFLAHILLMYADDALFTQVAKAIGLNARLLLSFCQAFGFPMSWTKLQLGPSVEFIGWQLHFRAGGFCFPSDKVAKLLAAIELVLRPGPIHWRDLDSLVGWLRWILQLVPELTSWLCTL